MIAELERTGGHIARTAWLMNVGRMTVYRYINRWKLWPVVNRTRRERFEGRQVAQTESLVQRTRAALRS